jgi:hypothetical protein
MPSLYLPGDDGDTPYFPGVGGEAPYVGDIGEELNDEGISRAAVILIGYDNRLLERDSALAAGSSEACSSFHGMSNMCIVPLSDVTAI